MKMKITRVLVPLLILSSYPRLNAQSIPVEIRDEGNGTFTLLRGGEPYWIEGAGTSNTLRFAELAARGGNSVRTWGTDSGTGELLDSAYVHGLSVMLGLWIGRETDGFDYNDQTAVASQLEKFRQVVTAYRDHPALLAWGIGNEANAGYSNLKVWDAVNDISRMIHELDGNHPTLTVTADISQNLANTLSSRAPDLDLLGVNSYGGLSGVPGKVEGSDWKKPYIITEWGINGPWETGHTSWGAPLEPTSSEKALTFQNRYQNVIQANQGKLLGSYAFLWNSKTEGTLTWFGLFVNNETTEMTDVLQYMWTGSWPENRAPQIIRARMLDAPEQRSYILTHAAGNRVEILSDDPDGDSLRYEFLIRPETGEEGLTTLPGNTFPGIPGIISDVNGDTAGITFGNGQNNRNYRLYIFVRDGKGHVGTANLPLRTQLVDLEPDLEFMPVQDAFVRNGIHADTKFGKTNPTRLQVKYSMTEDSTMQAYLLFDLSYAPGSFSSAWLELFGEGPHPAEVQALAVGGYSWDEKELTWNSRVVPDSGPIAVNQTFGNGGQWYSWDVKDYLEEAFARNDRLITFVLQGSTVYEGGPVVFNSKEAGSDPPRLRFNSNPVGLLYPKGQRAFIRPNPAVSRINIYLPEQFQDDIYLQLFSLTGNPLRQYSATGNPVSLSIRDLPEGVYILRITGKNASKTVTLKFIKTLPRD